MIGRTLSHYKVLEKIGEGGMGEVYLAKDTKLDREVAVKVLPATFSENKERLARFEREARLLASLNHPNIAAIHELEEADGVHFLALEYVPGETLAERIKRGPIPVDEALPLFKQIAEGLEAAHEKGVIHRDLKPANIKVTPEGKVKVLDFGLAKAMAGDTPVQGLSESPTITREHTEAGVLLGTAPYMSPEQARGKAVDKRTDIWAFGCCLYEALTGKTAYLGDTVTDTIAKIVEREPDGSSYCLHSCKHPEPAAPLSSERAESIAFMIWRTLASRSRRCNRAFGCRCHPCHENTRTRRALSFRGPLRLSPLSLLASPSGTCDQLRRVRLPRCSWELSLRNGWGHDLPRQTKRTMVWVEQRWPSHPTEGTSSSAPVTVEAPDFTCVRWMKPRPDPSLERKTGWVLFSRPTGNGWDLGRG